MTRDELLSPAKRDERARKYLRSKEKPQPNGRIREAIASLAFLILISTVTITLLLM
jgi:hypothetical protein